MNRICAQPWRDGRTTIRWLFIVQLLWLIPVLRGEGLLAAKVMATDFVLSGESGVASLCAETGADPAVVRAMGDLASDIERVTDRKPRVGRDVSASSGDVVLVGVLGQSPLIDDLVRRGKIDVAGLRGSWESYVVQVVPAPRPGVHSALVIVGSDRRGAIYGVYEISAAIGVSPWYWWADVAPIKRRDLRIAAGTHRYGPPSVKYRGIFLNDEDWGLQPWAAKTFEPEHGGIGPKTYARIFELLLRLKANTLWPAMHACSPPFNALPENAALAHAYGVVMGSSHAEPMLRNNVREWKDAPARYDYTSNRAGVLKYWAERVEANGRYENIYTLGMRGIHDSGMQGPRTDVERVRTLEEIFRAQRALLSEHVNRDLTAVPQVFCAYKEVLPLYRAGLRVPPDVTVMFPDDNFGYVRAFPTESERTRTGGFGIYYHVSYLGAPLSYLWLCTTPPALIWEEMTKAYALGADRMWIVNVGDLKPAEIDTEFFLTLAWNAHRWADHPVSEFLVDWATREFGAEVAPRIVEVLGDYYRLNDARKPEHLQWWLPKQRPRPSPWSEEEIRTRLATFAALRARVEELQTAIPAAKRDAFFELVAYPVCGSALANERYFDGELSAREAVLQGAHATELAARADAADAQLHELTRVFNEKTAGGKWRGLMALEPADRQWSSMRLAPWTLPHFAPDDVTSRRTAEVVVAIRAAGQFDRKLDRTGARWQKVDGLGQTADAVVAGPANAASIATAQIAEAAPRIEYELNFPAAGNFAATFRLVPTHPLRGSALRFAIALDRDPPQLVSAEIDDGGPTWASGVLNAALDVTRTIRAATPGVHTLKIFMVDAGVVLDQIKIVAEHKSPGAD